MTALIFRTKTNPNQEFTTQTLWGLSDKQWDQLPVRKKAQFIAEAQNKLDTPSIYYSLIRLKVEYLANNWTDFTVEMKICWA